MTKENQAIPSKIFAITEEQIQKIWANVGEMPTKLGVPIYDVLKSLPLINQQAPQEEKEAKSKPESNKKSK